MRGAWGAVQGRLLSAALRVAIGGQQAYAERMCRQKDMYAEWFLRADPIAAPLLFLLSHADRISCPSHIHTLIAEKRKGGTAVWWHDFGGSSHVQHLSAYAAEYRLQLLRFLRSLPAFQGLVAPSHALTLDSKL